MAQLPMEGKAYHKLSPWMWYAFYFISTQPHVTEAADLSCYFALAVFMFYNMLEGLLPLMSAYSSLGHVWSEKDM